jgi:hypothetical protein
MYSEYSYSAKDDTWVVKENLNCNDLLKAYHDELNEELLKREEQKLKASENAKKSGEYEVEAIMGKKKRKLKNGIVQTKYLIRWKGWDESE